MRHNSATDTREVLRSFGAPIRDRSAPVHFAGRRDELDHILVNARHPAAGNTMVLGEAATRFREAGGQALLYEAPWSKDGEDDVIRDIAVAALDLDPGVFSTTEQSAKTDNGSIAGVSGSVTRTLQTPPVGLTRWTAFVRRYRETARDSRTVLVLVDESQNLDDDAGELIHALHTQSGFPFTLVCGGLSDTKDKLRDIGVSRLGAMPSCESAR